MNTVTTKRDLLENCRNSEYREALVFENVYTSICSQIRVLREQRELSQSAFGRKVKMAQERISILEDPNAETKPTLNTLLRVASGFDVGLDVRFVAFGTIIHRSVDTDSLKLQVASFDEELPELEKQLEEEESEEQDGCVHTASSDSSGRVVVINDRRKPPRNEEIIESPEGEYGVWRLSAHG